MVPFVIYADFEATIISSNEDYQHAQNVWKTSGLDFDL